MATRRFKAETHTCWYVGLLALATVGLYVAACCLPASTIGEFSGGALDDGPVRDVVPSRGWTHLAFGWMSGPQGWPAWSANFVLLAGLLSLLRQHFRTAAVFGILATLLGLTTLTSFKHDGVYLGYYCWQFSQAVFSTGACLVCCWTRNRTTAVAPAF